MTASPFADPQEVAGYREKPPRQVPGFADLHRMTGLLLAERTPADGRVLVLGAGGGLELEHLAAVHAGWSFDGVDPSAEMLRLAAGATRPYAQRVRLLEGYITDAPPGPFDAGVCLLTLHFLPSAERLETLREVHRRLVPGAPFVVAHHTFPSDPGERDTWLARSIAFGGGPDLDAERARAMARTMAERLPALSPAEDEALLREAGFEDVGLFYAGLTFRGWIAYA